MHEFWQGFMKNLLFSIAINLKLLYIIVYQRKKMKEAHYKNKGTGLKELTLAKYGTIQAQKYHLVKKEFISYTDNIQIYQGGIRGKF